MELALSYASSHSSFKIMMNYTNNNIISPSMTKKSSLFISRTLPISISLHKKHLSSFATLAAPSTLNELDDAEVEKRKHTLLNAIQDTQRGLVTTPDQRSSIEEALVSVETCDAGGGLPLDLEKLDGTWRLQYTSASDVLILLQSSSTLPFFQVGPIYQKFESRNQSRGGIVQNVVRWSIPNVLEEQEGATLVVSAKFSVVSIRNIYLEFEEIAVQNINISEKLQALIAPALLPRSFLTLQSRRQTVLVEFLYAVTSMKLPLGLTQPNDEVLLDSRRVISDVVRLERRGSRLRGSCAMWFIREGEIVGIAYIPHRLNIRRKLS